MSAGGQSTSINTKYSAEMCAIAQTFKEIQRIMCLIQFVTGHLWVCSDGQRILGLGTKIGSLG